MPDLVALLPLVGIALLFWLLVVRPQSRRQQQLRTVQGGLEVGDEVLLTSGIYGTVAHVEEERIGLELSPGVVVPVARQAVMKVVAPAYADDAPHDVQDSPEGEAKD